MVHRNEDSLPLPPPARPARPTTSAWAPGFVLAADLLALGDARIALDLPLAATLSWQTVVRQRVAETWLQLDVRQTARRGLERTRISVRTPARARPAWRRVDLVAPVHDGAVPVEPTLFDATLGAVRWAMQLHGEERWQPRGEHPRRRTGFERLAAHPPDGLTVVRADAEAWHARLADTRTSVERAIERTVAYGGASGMGVVWMTAAGLALGPFGVLQGAGVMIGSLLAYRAWRGRTVLRLNMREAHLVGATLSRDGTATTFALPDRTLEGPRSRVAWVDPQGDLHLVEPGWGGVTAVRLATAVRIGWELPDPRPVSALDPTWLPPWVRALDLNRLATLDARWAAGALIVHGFVLTARAVVAARWSPHPRELGALRLLIEQVPGMPRWRRVCAPGLGALVPRDAAHAVCECIEVHARQIVAGARSAHSKPVVGPVSTGSRMESRAR